MSLPDHLFSPLEVAKILLVDDEPQALKWFSRLYADEFDVVVASGAEEALEVLASQGGEVAVILTDYRMPSRDGVALLSDVRRQHPHITRLLMSAFADKDVALAAVNRGSVELILEKPLDETQTRQALRDARQSCHRRLRDQELLRRRDESLRETLGFLAHEISTPLATVTGYLTAMRDHQGGQACPHATQVCPLQQVRTEHRSMLEAALRRADYAQSLVTSFVRTARDAYHADGSASQWAADLVRAVREDYPLVGEEVGWVRLQLDHDFVLPGQRDLLYLVLCTLVKNALLALHAAPPARPEIVVELLQEGDVPVIRVSDNGPGIAPEVLGRLTREPVSTRESQGGHGMGLVFCRRVMLSLGGDIKVVSPTGAGAAVSLYFKCREGQKIQ